MSFNPYESSESDPVRAQVPPVILDGYRNERPWGIVLLALWHFAQGLVPGAALIFLYAIGKPPPTVALGLPLFVMGLSIAIGIGVLRGENWGWRGSSFFNVIQVVQPALLLVRGVQPGPWTVLEAVVGVVAFLYLFRDEVLRYFGMFGIDKLNTARRIIVICCILLAIITFMN